MGTEEHVSSLSLLTCHIFFCILIYALCMPCLPHGCFCTTFAFLLLSPSNFLCYSPYINILFTHVLLFVLLFLFVFFYSFLSSSFVTFCITFLFCLFHFVYFLCWLGYITSLPLFCLLLTFFSFGLFAHAFLLFAFCLFIFFCFFFFFFLLFFLRLFFVFAFCVLGCALLYRLLMTCHV